MYFLSIRSRKKSSFCYKFDMTAPSYHIEPLMSAPFISNWAWNGLSMAFWCVTGLSVSFVCKRCRIIYIGLVLALQHHLYQNLNFLNFIWIVCFSNSQFTLDRPLSSDRLLRPKRSSALIPKDRLLSSGSSALDATRRYCLT